MGENKRRGRPKRDYCRAGLHKWEPDNLYTNGRSVTCRRCALSRARRRNNVLRCRGRYRKRGLTKRGVVQAFTDRAVMVESGCLLLGEGGYISTSFRGRNVDVHRLVLEVKLGRSLHRGEVTRHTCHRPHCIAESHLVVGTQADNIADMIRAGRRRGRMKISPGDREGIRAAMRSARRRRRKGHKVRLRDCHRFLAKRYNVAVDTIAFIDYGYR